jgi:uncharacterized membrane protein YhdT
MQALMDALRALKDADAAHISTLVWFPIILWLGVRLVLQSLRNARDPARMGQPWDLLVAGVATAVLLPLQAWPEGPLPASEHHGGPWGGRSIGEWAVMLLQASTAALLAVRVVIVVLEFTVVIGALRRNPSALATVVRQVNLRRIMAARDATGMAVLYVIAGVVHAYLTRSEQVTTNVALWVAAACLPPLVLSFGLAIQAVHGRFRLEARRLLLGGIGAMEQLEVGLSEIAQRSVAAQMMVREIFMSEILRIAVACLFALGTRL